MENITLVTTAKCSDRLSQPTRKTHKRELLSAATALSGRKAGSRSTSEPSAGFKFLSAGLAACAADLMTFPLDTAKVRLQIQGETAPAPARVPATAGHVTSSPGHVLAPVGARELHLDARAADAAAGVRYKGVFGTICTIARQEGPRSLYSGLAPGLQRQMAFGCVRIGMYDSVKQMYADFFKAGDKNNAVRIVAGMTTGALAVSCAQPTDVVKVRLQAQGVPGNVKRYSGTIHAYVTIAQKEGVAGLWRGTMPNIARNSVVNACELVSYDIFKTAILKHKIFGDNIGCHFSAAFGAGFVTTVVASPIDVVKTRFMNSAPGQYRGALDCAAGMYRHEGCKAFYKGFMPSFVRLGTWNVAMFICYEQLKQAYAAYKADTPSVMKAYL